MDGAGRRVRRFYSSKKEVKMKLLSALFDTVVNLPIAIAGDIVSAPARIWIDGQDSLTRGVLEKIEENLRL